MADKTEVAEVEHWYRVTAKITKVYMVRLSDDEMAQLTAEGQCPLENVMELVGTECYDGDCEISSDNIERIDPDSVQLEKSCAHEILQ